MRNWAAKFKGLIAFIKIVRDISELESVFQISSGIADPAILNRIGDHVSAVSPLAAQAIVEKPRIDLDALYASRESLPEGSLGREFLEFLESRKLDPRDIPRREGKTNAEFVQAHLYETHDLWHVILGFETDVSGELGLQAYYFSKFPGPLSAILLAAGLLNTAFFKIEERTERFDEIVRGWQLGKKTGLLFGVDWNLQWRLPLSEVRKRYEIPTPDRFRVLAQAV